MALDSSFRESGVKEQGRERGYSNDDPREMFRINNSTVGVRETLLSNEDRGRSTFNEMNLTKLAGGSVP
jgi:hypothetical protein